MPLYSVKSIHSESKHKITFGDCPKTDVSSFRFGWLTSYFELIQTVLYRVIEAHQVVSWELFAAVCLFVFILFTTSKYINVEYEVQSFASKVSAWQLFWRSMTVGSNVKGKPVTKEKARKYWSHLSQYTCLYVITKISSNWNENFNFSFQKSPSTKPVFRQHNQINVQLLCLNSM